jgi:hypothetical protein
MWTFPVQVRNLDTSSAELSDNLVILVPKLEQLQHSRFVLRKVAGIARLGPVLIREWAGSCSCSAWRPENHGVIVI